ncbi:MULTISPECIES: hypothetical protein [Paenibacillus]|uniref:hypothetical protein n=1 Tax=Paenibacillus TaxID=44249 RepID=UPI0002EC666A|nr:MULTISPECIES: hypothetical protein [Paenibacillus]MBU7320293.1 hypothetical protein [Paenibacillus oleatilyticus]
MEEKIKKLIEDLYYQREQYGERIVSLHHGYDAAIEELCKLVGIEFKPFEG